MKKVSLILLGSLIISITLTGCASKATNNTVSKVDQNTNKITNQNSESQQSQNKIDTPKPLTFNLVSTTYLNKNTKIDYPQITGFSDTDKQKQINALIKNDILNDYQNDIASLVKYYYKSTEEAEGALTEDVKYYIKLNSTNLLSILYVKDGSIPGSAHPSTSVHSINIDVDNETALKFKDLINIDNSFILKFKNTKNRMWTPKSLPGVEATDELNKELPGAIDAELGMLQDKDLIDQFNADDYSFYFTKDNFGMIFYLPHALGDYAELNIKYKDIKDSIKPENKAFNDLISTK